MSDSSQHPDPPPGVSGAAAEWFRQMLDAYDFDGEVHSQRLLGEAAVAFQRLLECRAVLSDDGLFTFDRFGQRKEHPAAVAERSYVGILRLLIRELNIEAPSDERSRLPRLGGYE